MSPIEKYNDGCDKIHVLARLGCNQNYIDLELMLAWETLLESRKACDHKFLDSRICQLCGYSIRRFL